VNLFKDYIARAFPDGDDLILDSEVLMVDNETGRPLPFGTLGIHKVRRKSALSTLDETDFSRLASLLYHSKFYTDSDTNYTII